MSEYLSAHGPDQIKSPETSRDKLFEIVDRKIDLVTELYQYTNSLKFPTRQDTKQLRREEQFFANILEKSQSMFPKKQELVARLDQIESDLKALPITANRDDIDDDDFINKMEQLAMERKQILDDDDVTFMVRFRRGIPGAVKKRGQVREMLKEVIDIGGGLSKPASYRKYLEGNTPPELIDGIDRVMPSSFSISFIVRQEEYDRQINLGSGIHMEKSPFNFIKDQSIEMINNDTADALLYGVKPGMAVIVDHENAHSFLEEFNFNSDDLFEIGVIDRVINRINRLKEGKVPAVIIGRNVTSVSNILLTFIDRGKEELIAELVSKPCSQRFPDFPKSTYNMRMRELFGKLDSYKNIDPVLDDAINKVKQRADVDKLKTELASLYQEVKNRYKEDPEKLKIMLAKLDSALILFPPSKFRHIRNWLDWKLDREGPIDDK